MGNTYEAPSGLFHSIFHEHVENFGRWNAAVVAAFTDRQ